MSITVHPHQMRMPKNPLRVTHKQVIAFATFTDDARMGLCQYYQPWSDCAWSGLSRLVRGRAPKPFTPTFGRDEQIITFNPQTR